MAGFDITIEPSEAAVLLGACKQEYSWDKESQLCVMTSKSATGLEDIYSFPDKSKCCLEFSKVEEPEPSTISDIREACPNKSELQYSESDGQCKMNMFFYTADEQVIEHATIIDSEGVNPNRCCNSGFEAEDPLIRQDFMKACM